MHRRSASIDLRRMISLVRHTAAMLRRDLVAVYAAQASFFMMLSAIPALVLLLSVSRHLAGSVSQDALAYLIEALPQDFRAVFRALLSEIGEHGTLPLLSVTAATALWSASRGMASLERGLRGVYGIDARGGYFADVLRSIVSTVMFLLLLMATLLLLVFSANFTDALLSRLPALTRPIETLMRCRGILMLTVLTLFFSLSHRTVLRRAEEDTSDTPRLPGALFSAAGWMLFSYFYSIYIRHFPRASYLVGSLAVVVMLMLWVYFCMMIFLAGAEVNKAWGKWSHKR